MYAHLRDVTLTFQEMPLACIITQDGLKINLKVN